MKLIVREVGVNQITHALTSPSSRTSPENVHCYHLSQTVHSRAGASAARCNCLPGCPALRHSASRHHVPPPVGVACRGKYCTLELLYTVNGCVNNNLCDQLYMVTDANDEMQLLAWRRAVLLYKLSSGCKA